MYILDGKAYSQEIEKELSIEVDRLKAIHITPCLYVILVGDNPASLSYVTMKNKACSRVGIESKIIKFDENISQNVLLDEIDKLNNDKNVNGILVQLPLPKHINSNIILESIDINKDVDGFHPYNMGRLFCNLDSLLPATPFGIMMLLEHYKIDVKGKDVVIVGASNIVGKPLASLMLNAGASVSVCHIFTKDVKKFTKDADIVCVGVGKALLLSDDMVKDGAIIVDIGINKLDDGSIVGDVDFKNVSMKASYITPVPGGVGPMTISALLINTIKASKLQYEVAK